MAIATGRLTVEEFLKLPKTQPASEYIEGEIIQKPLPKIKHSLLQLRTCNEINQVTQTPKIDYAFPELRCTFGGQSIVPDIAVLLWKLNLMRAVNPWMMC
jgi:Uma2 family endonuclease